MRRIARNKLTTFEQFCLAIREDQKADLIDGVIYMASPENTDANEVFGWLFPLLQLFVEEEQLGKLYGSRVAFQLDEYNGPEPDIGFVNTAHLERIARGRVHGPPDLAIEIVCPESIERDYQKKRRQYQKFGVPEYWIVDEIEETTTFLRLRTRSRYREIELSDGIFVSEALPGFWLDPSWLWQVPRPRLLTTLKTIRRGKPG